MPANTSYKPRSLIKLVVLIATLFITACQTVDTNKNLSSNVMSVDSFPILEVIGVFSESDGDSVSLISLDHKMRYTTIMSIANLGDNYVNLKVGDRVQIAGEYAESYPVRIFAKQVMKIANPDKEKCESNNSKNTGSNVWKPQGKAQIPACISTYTDAGKACTS